MMNWETRADVERTLNAALCGKLCVQAWLGIANVLFIGFGDEVLPQTVAGEKHPTPLYEMQTGWADWWIQDQHNTLVTSNDSKENAKSAAERLVGMRVKEWCFQDESSAIRIVFERGLELRMAPYDTDDVSENDAWILRGPVYYGYMRWDGIIGHGRRDHYFVDEDGS